MSDSEHRELRRQVVYLRKISADKEAIIADLHVQLNEMEEKCQFWCDEARKLGYKE